MSSIHQDRLNCTLGRTTATVFTALLAVMLAGGCERGSDDDAGVTGKINVLLITMDTTRADALGCYGQKLPTTPNIDRLAAEGTLFTQCVSAAPSTLPSHASIMTGRYPFVHGARSNFGYVLPEENVTLAEVLKQAGYVTAAEIASTVIASRTQLDQGFDTYRDPNAFDIKRVRLGLQGAPNTPPVELAQRRGNDIAEHGIRFIRANVDKPFFLWLHFFDPHEPYAAPPAYGRLIPSSRYLAEVRFADNEIGRVLSELDRLHLASRTLVVLTADHGEGLGAHHEETHSFFVYDTTIHVPLIFRGAPRTLRGKRVTTLVRTVDIAPTVLDLLGRSALKGVQGTSLKPLLGGRTSDLELLGYGESIESKTAFGYSILRYVREGSWKLIHKTNPELFDVTADPQEMNNRYAQEPEIAGGLRAQLERLIRNAPPAAGGAAVQNDAESLAQLAALGYVGGTPLAEENELALLEPTGEDPTRHLEAIDLATSAWSLFMSEAYEECVPQFKELLRTCPDSIHALRGLSQALAQLDQTDEAIEYLRRLVAMEPNVMDSHIRLAGQLHKRGDNEEARKQLEAAIRINPCASMPRIDLANLLGDNKRYRDKLDALRQATRDCPQSFDFANDYAYALATSPVDDLRDGQEALRIATRIVDATSRENPAMLDTLAAAYAEIGDFKNALAVGREAISLLAARDLPEAMEVFRSHLESFESGKPIRED